MFSRDINVKVILNILCFELSVNIFVLKIENNEEKKMLLNKYFFTSN
jgi:hypothetical protein